MSTVLVSSNVEHVMGRAILDEAFRNQLFASPEAAIRAAGLALSAEELDNLKAGIERVREQPGQVFGSEPVRGWS